MRLRVQRTLDHQGLLHNIGSFRVFKEFVYPTEMSELRDFVKANYESLHLRSVQNLMVFERLFADMTAQSAVGPCTKPSPSAQKRRFVTTFKMSE